MTDRNHYSLVLVIDRSSSIHPFRGAMLRGLQDVIDRQASSPGTSSISVVAFDEQVEIMHVLQHPQNVRLTLDAGGRTALHDGLGMAILTVHEATERLPEPDRPWRTQVVLVTDGSENASRLYDLDTIRALVARQRSLYGWRFMLLAANQGSDLTGVSLGFGDYNFAFEPSNDGVTSMARNLSTHLSSTRLGATDELITKPW